MQVFTPTIQNIHSYIPHETTTSDKSNMDEWENKKKVLHENRVYNTYSRNRSNFYLLDTISSSLFKNCNWGINESIIHAYLIKLSDKRLSDSKTSPKSYFSILKPFVKYKKILVLPLCCTRTNFSWTLGKRLNS